MDNAENPYKDREVAHKECKGCKRIVHFEETGYCSAYAKPSAWWRRGFCPLSTHVEISIEGQEGKKRVGQQKQKKKSRK